MPLSVAQDSWQPLAQPGPSRRAPHSLQPPGKEVSPDPLPQASDPCSPTLLFAHAAYIRLTPRPQGHQPE